MMQGRQQAFLFNDTGQQQKNQGQRRYNWKQGVIGDSTGQQQAVIMMKAFQDTRQKLKEFIWPDICRLIPGHAVTDRQFCIIW